MSADSRLRSADVTIDPSISLLPGEVARKAGKRFKLLSTRHTDVVLRPQNVARCVGAEQSAEKNNTVHNAKMVGADFDKRLKAFSTSSSGEKTEARIHETALITKPSKARSAPHQTYLCCLGKFLQTLCKTF